MNDSSWKHLNNLPADGVSQAFVPDRLSAWVRIEKPDVGPESATIRLLPAEPGKSPIDMRLADPGKLKDMFEVIDELTVKPDGVHPQADKPTAAIEKNWVPIRPQRATLRVRMTSTARTGKGTAVITIQRKLDDNVFRNAGRAEQAKEWNFPVRFERAEDVVDHLSRSRVSRLRRSPAHQGEEAHDAHHEHEEHHAHHEYEIELHDHHEHEMHLHDAPHEEGQEPHGHAQPHQEPPHQTALQRQKKINTPSVVIATTLL